MTVRQRRRSAKASHHKIAGAVEAPFPAFIEPSHPTLRPRPPKGAQWVHEIKVDGYRAQLHIKPAKISIFTRRGNDWSLRFSTIADAARALSFQTAVIDGEVIIVDDKGLSDFSALQSDLAASRTDRLVFQAFDLLYADGLDLRKARLTDRKAALAAALEHADGHLRYSEHLEGDGEPVFAQACKIGLEGIVSKLRDAPYRSGRNEAWIKAVCRKRDTYPVVGFIAGPAHTIAALYLGRHEGKSLLYAGKAGTGFTGQSARDLRERLDPLITRTSPLTKRIRKPKATWVRPEMLVDVEYRAVTPDGHLRHASFKGIREDLSERRK